jgi:hypothetical protein
MVSRMMLANWHTYVGLQVLRCRQHDSSLAGAMVRSHILKVLQGAYQKAASRMAQVASPRREVAISTESARRDEVPAR